MKFFFFVLLFTSSVLFYHSRHGFFIGKLFDLLLLSRDIVTEFRMTSGIATLVTTIRILVRRVYHNSPVLFFMVFSARLPCSRVGDVFLEMVHYSGAVRDLHLSFSAAKGVHMLGCWIPLHKGKRSIWRFSGVVPDDLRRFVSFLSRSRQKRCLCDFRINLFLYRPLEINDSQLNTRSPRFPSLSLSPSLPLFCSLLIFITLSTLSTGYIDLGLFSRLVGSVSSNR